MLKIVYSPEYGQTCCDKDVDDFIKGYLQFAFDPRNIDKDISLTVGSELIILALRAKIAKGELASEDVVFYFNDKIVEHTSDGSLVCPPVGYCDHYQNYVKILTQKRRSTIKSIS